MKIISWNCQGGFRNKYQEILDLKPDMVILLECESIERLKFGNGIPMPNDHFYYSENSKKGIAVLSYCDFRFEKLAIHNPIFRHIIPLKMFNLTHSFYLFVIWAMENKEEPNLSYIGQVWRAIHFYEPLLDENCLLVGDFNSNSIWDKPKRNGNHSDIVAYLNQHNIFSAYHELNQEEQGKESQKTFYMHRNVNKSYHIDYAFLSKAFLSSETTLQIGNHDKWLSYSDHMPLVLELGIPEHYRVV